jgi:hypothetical protein
MLSRLYAESLCAEPCVEPLSRCVLKVCCAWDAYVWGRYMLGRL